MDIQLNKSNERNQSNEEANKFINELNDYLEKGQKKEIKENMNGILYNQICEEIDLAKKYKSKLNGIIKECMINESYEYDFWYVNYGKKEKSYFLNYFNDGHSNRIKLTQKEVENKYQVGAIYVPVGKDGVYKNDNMLTSIKIDVESKLNWLEYCKNKK